MPASQAMIGYGSKFLIDDTDSGSPSDFIELAEVFNITPPNQQVDDVAVTHNQSPNRTREFIPGLIDPGECSFEMNFVPGSASDVLLRALKSSGAQRNCRIQFPNAETWDFLASVKGIEPSMATEDRMTATITMRVSGDIVSS